MSDRRMTFTFDGVVSSAYGVYISGGGTFNAAARDYETLEIPGRDGVLTLDNGRFESIRHSYDAFIVPGFSANVEGLRNQLMARRGHKRLTDGYHPDEFYLAYYERGLEVEPTDTLREGRLEIIFTRDPRRFLTSGETVTTLTADGSISNPTLYSARPLLRVYGAGQLGVGDQYITISQADVYTDIDCEMREAFKGTLSKNQYITLTGDDFPVLHAGSTGLQLGSGITRVEITPRWYRL